MRVGQSRAPILRRMRAGVAPALPAQCAALFAATAIAFAAPGPALSAGEPGESAASDEAATGAAAQPADPAAPPESAEMPAAEAPASPAADVQRAEPPPAPAGDGVTGEPSGAAAPDGETATAPAEPPPPTSAVSATATHADNPVVARAPAGTRPTARFAAPPAPPAAPAPAPTATPGQPAGTPPVVQVAPPQSTTCPMQAILGTEGDDVLTGTSGPDFICGLGGDDSIDGGAGDDTIDGGPGDDEVAGGDGDDKIAGADGHDRLAGGAGNDCLAGGAGNDRLDGGPGNDVLDGGSGENELIGGDGADAGSGPLSDLQPGDASSGSFDPLTGDCNALINVGSAGDLFENAVNRVEQGIAKLLGAAVEDAQAATPEPLKVAPLDDPLALRDGYARLRVTCTGALATSTGELTLTTFDERPVVRRRPIGDSTPFACSAADAAPVVKVRVPIADRRLIRRVGALRVRATAIVEDTDGPDTVARSVFTLVPPRP